MSDYADILKGSWGDVPVVSVLPDGSWLLRGQSASFQPAKDADKQSRVMFVYTPKEPMDDVDAAALTALGADYEFDANRIFFNIFVGSRADWDKVRNHLKLHGIDTPEDKSIEDSLKEFKGTEVVAYLQSRTYQNNSGAMQEDNVASGFAAVS